jgi:hypothetical protein
MRKDFKKLHVFLVLKALNRSTLPEEIKSVISRKWRVDFHIINCNIDDSPEIQNCTRSKKQPRGITLTYIYFFMIFYKKNERRQVRYKNYEDHPEHKCSMEALCTNNYSRVTNTKGSISFCALLVHFKNSCRKGENREK